MGKKNKKTVNVTQNQDSGECNVTTKRLDGACDGKICPLKRKFKREIGEELSGSEG